MDDPNGWTLADLPDLSGRRALVTGVTSGIGEKTALELARHGAEVILAARSEEKLDVTEAHLRSALPDARLHRVRIDLADLSSVRRAAARAAQLGPLHLLVNNAGVMATPYHRTVDGFELQLATNHLGPFLLTGLLLPRLVESGDGRVVSVSSQAHRLARRAPLDDPRVHHARHSAWSAYARSKLADLLFTFELDRRCREERLPVKAVAAHPGFSATGLMAQRGGGGLRSVILEAAFSVAGQPSELGALPTLMAATADLPGSSYVGPSNFLQLRGLPRIVTPRRLARDPEAQRRLWEVSEEATGIRYP
ncbi:MAG TPA: oxidoreductase [Marmoricola sp.]|jgi:NAD(P)-dependent dehydrogenase (short-subunit alcohol dehydrogenase family)|nr:oxidoreductase [Marmoricola sp.]